ncbi:MAG: HAD family phosphatase [Oscillospiraceae bacterium]|nr:HAD family phosphatase [Oscillospiraceae bacterium]
MKVSCFVFDLDGTLLNSENKISDIDKETLREISKLGIKVVIATGRSDLQIKEYVHSLGISAPIITCNGGQIKNLVSGEIIYRKLLRSCDVKDIIDYAIQQGIDYLFYTPDYVYHSSQSERIKLFMNYNKTAPEKFRVPIRPACDYPEKEAYENVLKVLIIGNEATIPLLENKFNKDNTLTIVSSGQNLIDIMPENTTKGNAVSELAKYLNIPISEVVAFGDSPNDEAMLCAAGFSVAMGNATDSIKNICDYVTKSNDDFGITYAVNHILNEI